tara:strand:- start:257 stop:463 length:207 start_codon:yes stop_codon:yes gene_type:complete
MKIYKLTIGINEQLEEVEFIKEEQYNIEKQIEIPDPNIEAAAVAAEEDGFKDFLDMLIRKNYNIIGIA